MKIDLGCGDVPKEGFTGLDQHDWGLPNVMLVDLTKGIPLEDNSVEEIYSGHFFEHLGKFEVQPMLKECYRVLQPSGKAEIVVPDLIKVMTNFINTPIYQKYGWPLDTIFGGQAHEGEFHKTGFWPELLQALFTQAGFVRINVLETQGWSQPCLTTIAYKGR